VARFDRSVRPIGSDRLRQTLYLVQPLGDLPIGPLDRRFQNIVIHVGRCPGSAPTASTRNGLTRLDLPKAEMPVTRANAQREIDVQEMQVVPGHISKLQPPCGARLRLGAFFPCSNRYRRVFDSRTSAKPGSDPLYRILPPCQPNASRRVRARRRIASCPQTSRHRPQERLRMRRM